MFSPNIGMPNALRFEPPTNPGAVTDVAVDWNDNTENKGIFLSNNGNAHSLISNIDNVGNQSESSIGVTSNITPLFSMPVVVPKTLLEQIT